MALAKWQVEVVFLLVENRNIEADKMQNGGAGASELSFGRGHVEQ